jgi:hypothetical protein
MALKNLDNERGNLLTLVNDMEAALGGLEDVVYNPQTAIADAAISVEATSPTTAEHNALVSTVNSILEALRAYGIIEESI